MKIVISALIIVLFFSCNENGAGLKNMDLDEAINLLGGDSKDLVFISAINNCHPCDLISNELKNNDTLISGLNKYHVAIYSGGNGKFSVVNRITENIKSPGIYIFDKDKRLKRVFWGYRNAKKFLEDLKRPYMLNFQENKHFNSLLTIYINVKNDRSLIHELNYLKKYSYRSFYLYYLAFRIDLNLQKKKEALLNAQKAITMSNNHIKFLYGSELYELNQFIKNN